jgi:hypothetical protein
MPAGDRTGPVGAGPMTGWGTGYCGGYDAPGWAAGTPGRGFYGRRGRTVRGARWGGYGPGPGGGRGWRHWYYATGLPRWARWGTPPAWSSPSREEEVEMLKDEAAWLTEQLDAINERMDRLSQE